MDSKPRIKRRKSILCGEWVWECSGSGSMGMGERPSDAYWDWKQFHNFHSQKKTIHQKLKP